MPDLLNEVPHCCSSCEHLYKMITEEPCMSCGDHTGHYTKWQPNEYLRNHKDGKK